MQMEEYRAREEGLERYSLALTKQLTIPKAISQHQGRTMAAPRRQRNGKTDSLCDSLHMSHMILSIEVLGHKGRHDQGLKEHSFKHFRKLITGFTRSKGHRTTACNSQVSTPLLYSQKY